MGAPPSHLDELVTPPGGDPTRVLRRAQRRQYSSPQRNSSRRPQLGQIGLRALTSSPMRGHFGLSDGRCVYLRVDPIGKICRKFSEITAVFGDRLRAMDDSDARVQVDRLGGSRNFGELRDAGVRFGFSVLRGLVEPGRERAGTEFLAGEPSNELRE